MVGAERFDFDSPRSLDKKGTFGKRITSKITSTYQKTLKVHTKTTYFLKMLKKYYLGRFFWATTARMQRRLGLQTNPLNMTKVIC